MDTQQEIEKHQRECEAHRKDWGEGPWGNEPDRVEFKHAGFQCLLSRNPLMGNWCGYVGVPKGHKAYGIAFDKAESDLTVHGGITYTNPCGGNICHVTEEEDDLYWLGFDCAHSFDIVPRMAKTLESLGDLPDDPWMGRMEYRSVDYVRREAEKLAEQLASLR